MGSYQRSIPHVHRHRITPFCIPFEIDGFGGAQVEANLQLGAPTKCSSIGSIFITQGTLFSSSATVKLFFFLVKSMDFEETRL